MNNDSGSEPSHVRQPLIGYRTITLCVLFVIGVGLIYGAWRVVTGGNKHDQEDLEQAGPTARPAEPLAQPLAPTKEAREAVFNSKIAPLVLEYQVKNDKAVAQALDVVKEHFGRFRKGIDPFTDDLTGWGTRGGIVKRLAKDKWDAWWNYTAPRDRSRVQKYVDDKFEAHIVSEAKVRTMLKEAIDQFQGNLEANRNELLLQVKTALGASDIPVEIRLSADHFDTFAKAVIQRMEANTQTLGPQSLVVMILSNLGGEVAGFAATELLAAGGVYLTSVFGLAIVEGGVGGAAAGSVVPGIGTAIGIGVGLVVGGIIDWWMTDQFKVKVAEDCNRFLDELERFTISGPAVKKGKPGNTTSETKLWPGLEQSFRSACDTSTESVRKALQQSVVESPL